jgi:ankyrin repeat protein
VTPEWNGSPIEKAHDNIEEARKDAFYVDRSTKDNALHSLARVNTHGDARRYPIADLLKFFVSSGVNLNHHNREGHHPLSAFICYQYMRSENDGDETGATTAEFLKIMLSKTGKLGRRDDLNKINVDMMNRRGATALHEAACCGQWECVKLLIEAGANMNARLSMTSLCHLIDRRLNPN